MISKCLAIAFLATASMTGAASAQATNQVDSTTTATTHKVGEWRASKLAGVNVYNEANEKIGDINEVIERDAQRSSAGVSSFSGTFVARETIYCSVAGTKPTPHYCSQNKGGTS